MISSRGEPTRADKPPAPKPAVISSPICTNFNQISPKFHPNWTNPGWQTPQHMSTLKVRLSTVKDHHVVDTKGCVCVCVCVVVDCKRSSCRRHQRVCVCVCVCAVVVVDDDGLILPCCCCCCCWWWWFHIAEWNVLCLLWIGVNKVNWG